MKILLDECVPKRLGRLLAEHEVVTTPQAGWAGITNGELLQRASEDFDVFVTVDRNLAFQQNPSNLPLPVIVIHARSNKLRDLVHPCSRTSANAKFLVDSSGLSHRNTAVT